MLESRVESGVLIAKVTLTNVDMTVCADFQYTFGELIRSCEDFVLLDLSSVEFMDSSGLAAFVFCFQSTSIKNTLAVCGLNERVKRLFQITRLDTVLKIFDNENDALTSLKAPKEE